MIDNIGTITLGTIERREPGTAIGKSAAGERLRMSAPMLDRGKNIGCGVTGTWIDGWPGRPGPAGGVEGGLTSPAHADQLSAITLRRAPFVESLEDWHRLPLFGRSTPRFFAFVRFSVQRLCYAGRPSRLAQRYYLHVKLAAFVPDLQEISDFHLARGFHTLAVRSNPPQFAATRGQ
jgi:hypothetical protein